MEEKNVVDQFGELEEKESNDDSMIKQISYLYYDAIQPLCQADDKIRTCAQGGGFSNLEVIEDVVTFNTLILDILEQLKSFFREMDEEGLATFQIRLEKRLMEWFGAAYKGK